MRGIGMGALCIRFARREIPAVRLANYRAICTARTHGSAFEFGKGAGHGRSPQGRCAVVTTPAVLAFTPTGGLVAVFRAFLPCCARLACGSSSYFHSKADALAGHIHLLHLHLDDVAGLDHLARIVDKLVRQLAPRRR